jgi:hypothetical protein
MAPSGSLAFAFIAAALAFPAFLAAQDLPAATSGCSPNGNRFNLEPQANALSQFNESVAVLLNAGVNGGDLVVGTAQDERGLPPVGFNAGIPADGFYVQRGNSTCVADLEGELPIINSAVPSGEPMVVADAAHGAFFAVDIRTTVLGISKTTAATLLNTTACPNGTVANPVPCWPAGALIDSGSINAFLFDPAIAVDQRTSGTGAGDVYVVVSQANPRQTNITNIYVTVCNNSLSACSSRLAISGADTTTTNPWVQVRPDGGITVSYGELTFTNEIAQLGIRFVNCTPVGAPNPPTCSAPIAAINETQPLGVSTPGDTPVSGEMSYPRHVDRLESNGTTVTTFLVYDRCDVAITSMDIFGVDSFCPKTDVVVASSTDGGASWSAPQKVSTSAGQQFLSNVALDASTGTVNIAYYSTENDPLKLKPQIFLAQIPSGQITVNTPQQITSAFYGGSIPDLVDVAIIFPGVSYIGLAAAGTGMPGQSHVYIHFTGSTIQGNYGGVPFPVTNNILTSFVY